MRPWYIVAMSKDFQIKIRIEPDDHEKLRQLAEDDRRPISAYVRNLIEDHLKTHRPKRRITV